MQSASQANGPKGRSRPAGSSPTGDVASLGLHGSSDSRSITPATKTLTDKPAAPARGPHKPAAPGDRPAIARRRTEARGVAEMLFFQPPPPTPGESISLVVNDRPGQTNT